MDYAELSLLASVLILNQSGISKGNWDCYGIVVKVLHQGSCMVKMNGSGQLTKRDNSPIKPLISYNDKLRSLLDCEQQAVAPTEGREG